MVIAIPIYAVIRIVFVKARKIKLLPLREVGMLVFFTFTVGLLSLTVLPKIDFGIEGIKVLTNGKHTTDIVPFKTTLATFKTLFETGNIASFIAIFIGNVLMFVPIGFFVKYLWNPKERYVILTGFGISVFIEFCQLFLPRHTDIDDIMLNTLGTFIGLLLYKLCVKIFSKRNKSNVEDT